MSPATGAVRLDGGTMSMATRTDTQSPAPHVGDSHDLIRVLGARVNNLKDVSIEIPKRRLTVFTGVSGSGKSSLVFDTIAAESQRMINETYSAFVQGFMPTLARPDVDVLEGLTTAIIIDQQRMGADPAPRSAPPPTPTRCCAPCPPAPTSPTGPGRRGMRPGPATASLAGSAPGQAPGSDYPSWHRWPRHTAAVPRHAPGQMAGWTCRSRCQQQQAESPGHRREPDPN